MEMTDADFEAAVTKLEAAITASDGRVKPIRRVDFEVLENGAIHWSLWEERQVLKGSISLGLWCIAEWYTPTNWPGR